MAISPNVTFVSGAVYTAGQANRLPFGVCAFASSSTNYTLTTSVVIATGMTATFTAITDRLYKITYFEPFAGLPSTVGGNTNLTIRLNTAGGTALQSARATSPAASASINPFNLVYVGTFTAGSVTVVGCAAVSATTGTPVLGRSGVTLATFLVEDIGPS